MPESTSFDPVEVSTLAPNAVARNVTEALAAIAAASDLEALKAARLAHDGDRSPLALANREIGALPPAARKAAGQRVGAARGEVRAALEAAGDRAGCRTRRPRPHRRSGRRHAPLGSASRRCSPSAYHDSGAVRRHLRRHGIRGRRRPGDRNRVVQLRCAEHAARPSRANSHGHVLRRLRGLRTGSAHPYLARAGSDDAHPNPADLRRVPRQGVPHGRARRHPHARSSTRSRASSSTNASPWPT